MKQYPKIETLFKRDEQFNLTNELRNPVVETINPWRVTEKVDGMNIRVMLEPVMDHDGLYTHDVVRFGGRTDKAALPPKLHTKLIETFTLEKMQGLRLDEDPVSITLYGEGYGPGIQKGGAYSLEQDFILFDVLIGYRWWLDDDAVTEIADKLGIKRVPILGDMALPAVIRLAKEGFVSTLWSHASGTVPPLAEGIVARPIAPLFDSRGNRLIIKLKMKDFDRKLKKALTK